MLVRVRDSAHGRSISVCNKDGMDLGPCRCPRTWRIIAKQFPFQYGLPSPKVWVYEV
jgi:hypothetical protein